MKKMLLSFVFFAALAASAQPKLPFKKSVPSIKPVIEKVARDFYQNFGNIVGDTINENGSSIEFKSRITPPESLGTSITKYVDPYSYAWQSTMFESEDFQQAVSRYKEYFKQLNNSKLTFYDKTAYNLSGNYDAPDESRPFASSVLKLDGTNHDLQFFTVEVGLSYSMPDWTVKVMVYEKVPDSQVRPTIISSGYSY